MASASSTDRAQHLGHDLHHTCAQAPTRPLQHTASQHTTPPPQQSGQNGQRTHLLGPAPPASCPMGCCAHVRLLVAVGKQVLLHAMRVRIHMGRRQHATCAPCACVCARVLCVRACPSGPWTWPPTCLLRSSYKHHLHLLFTRASKGDAAQHTKGARTPGLGLTPAAL